MTDGGGLDKHAAGKAAEEEVLVRRHHDPTSVIDSVPQWLTFGETDCTPNGRQQVKHTTEGEQRRLHETRWTMDGKADERDL